MADPTYAASKEVARANLAFYRAFEQLDLEAMRAVWLDEESIRCVHPGWAMLSGRERVMASWEAIFQSTASIRFELSDPSIEIERNVAWVTLTECVRSSALGEGHAAEIAATNVYVKRGGSWRMVVHHASPLLRPQD